MRAARHFSEKAPIARGREDCRADGHSRARADVALLAGRVGLRCGLVDKHSDSAETGASVLRVSFIVGDAGINFEN